MPIKIKLSEIAESMDCQSEEIRAYINRETGKVEMFNDELVGAIEDDEDPDEAIEMYGGVKEDISLVKEIAKAEKWLSLPSKLDIHDYSIMQDFCRSQQDEGLRTRLENSIRGSEAFRRFRATIEQAGLLEKWYAFKNSAYLEIARRWCEENGVEFEE
jgi:hypothetical protein